jgi:tryptophan synthase alpha chain
MPTRRREVADGRHRIAEVFARCAKERRAAFIPYLCAGDPDLATTPDLVEALVDAGADIVELGVPFSDPIADGPVNQRAAYRALQSGTTLSGVLRLVDRCRERFGVPIVLFTYFNPIHVRGAAAFAEQAAESGVDGVLCVDLPPEEAETELAPALRDNGVDPIFLLAPTSTTQRIRRAGKVSRGFVYYVSRTGTTGERAAVPENLRREVRVVKSRVGLPVAVGFGISTPEQVAQVAEIADGVVVGSALVRVIEEAIESGTTAELPAALGRRAAELAAPLRSRRRRFRWR